MNMDVAVLTVRQLLGQKRTIVLGLIALLPLLLGGVFRFGDFDREPVDWAAGTLLAQFVVGTLLPLAALVFGTAAIGSEIDDGTAVYLLSKPLPRPRILVAKLVVAALATAGFVLVSAALAAGLAAAGEPGFARMLAAFAVAIVVGAFTYSSVFVALSLFTSRAFVAGLIYVFLWEGLITRLFAGLRVLSIRQYTLGVADGAAGLGADVVNARLEAPAAWILAIVVTIAAAVLASRRLGRFEVGETS